MNYDSGELSLGVSEFVALLNQTLDFAYPSLTITGELANLRVSKNRWVYFDLKDAESSVKFFGTVHQLPGPLENGMLLKVRGAPRLHNLYGFSVTVQSMTPTGEGTIRRAAELLQAKLQLEGLFDPARKRAVPFPPKQIGLIASGQSAGFADFIKIINARWGGLTVVHCDVQVQGEIAPAQIVAALEQLNTLSEPPDVIALIRGGGSPEDLAAFSTEIVTRAVATSRVPTVVGVGHEIDISLAELAADLRASTPSNAAELLVPEKSQAIRNIKSTKEILHQYGLTAIRSARSELDRQEHDLATTLESLFLNERHRLVNAKTMLQVMNPAAVLNRGFAIVRQNNIVISKVKSFDNQAPLTITLSDGTISIQ